MLHQVERSCVALSAAAVTCCQTVWPVSLRRLACTVSCPHSLFPFLLSPFVGAVCIAFSPCLGVVGAACALASTLELQTRDLTQAHAHTHWGWRKALGTSVSALGAALYCTALECIVLHSVQSMQYGTALHCTALPCIVLLVAACLSAALHLHSCVQDKGRPSPVSTSLGDCP
jgi:hypothetical protein